MDPSLVSANVTFAKPAHFDDLVDVDVECSRVGRSSFEIDMTMARGEDVLARLKMTYVNVDVVVEKSRPIPADVAEALQAKTPASHEPTGFPVFRHDSNGDSGHQRTNWQ